MIDERGSAPSAISLPKGGGAVRGIGETFQPNLFMGTGTYAVPLALSPGRGGFGPALALQYSAGHGNGPFGLGWQLSLPRVSRKTEQGLPRYDDTDTFVLSGVEDLVPSLERVTDPGTGTESWRPPEPVPHATHTIVRYRPRVEGLFGRIERWQHTSTGEIHWRATTADNVTSVYGASAASRIAHPDDPQRVYEWLLHETFDAVGNRVVYEYAADHPGLFGGDDPALGLPEIYEQRRRPAQRYLRRIVYGSLPEPLVDAQGHLVTYADGSAVGVPVDGRRYALEVVFDYGDWPSPTHASHPAPPPVGTQELFGPDPAVATSAHPVPVRADRFSSFRPGFEVRTLRRCARVLMFHHFAELGGPTLVQSTDLAYRTDPDTQLSLLVEVTVTSYRRDTAHTYTSASMPPVTFDYSTFRPQEQRYQSLQARGGDLPASGLRDGQVALVDLFGDGLPDVLEMGLGGFRYRRNLGGGTLDHPRALPHIPAPLALATAGVAFGDIGGDGHADLLVHTGPMPGFYETAGDDAWKTFTPYETFPSVSPADRNVRLVDLTGDGRSDLLITEAHRFLWCECLGEQGYGAPQAVARVHDLDRFPDVFFDDPAGRVRLADMSGGGLHDIVLVHNGGVDYWPNLGYGRFGARLTMAGAPRFGDDFDPKRLFLADLNGTGCADLVYVDIDRVHLWFNQSGNQWSEGRTILGTPMALTPDAVRCADVFGTGTCALVWSEDFAALPESHYKALDVCGGEKPYVLHEMRNGLGATTRVRYAPSTRHFLDDQAAGTPWVTRLPFPVQVLEKVEVIDHIGRTKRVSTFRYHHGYFDGREREFRGFGRVDQCDTETFDDFAADGLHPPGTPLVNVDAAYHAPPVETRTWFHTGVYVDEGALAFDALELTAAFQREFYQGDAEAVRAGEHLVALGDAPHEGYRALRGAVLRTEVYGRDGSARAAHPYSVVDHRHRVTLVQPAAGNPHAVYFRHALESVTSHYERRPDDPRITQSLTLAVDDYGHALRTLAIGYGRRRPDPGLPSDADRDTQARTFVSYNENRFTHAIDHPADLATYRAPRPCEARTYELTGVAPAAGRYFTFEDWAANGFARIDAAVDLPFEGTADPTRAEKRLLEHVRTYYRRDDLTAQLPLGAIESLALPGEQFVLALTPGLVAQVYGARLTDAMLTEAGYVHLEGDDQYWRPSGRSYFSPDAADSPAQELAFARRHFFLPHRARDPFGHVASTTYDTYAFHAVTTTDPVGNRSTAEIDYRVRQPFRVTDPNGNRAEVMFDTLGLIAGAAVMGKAGQGEGDALTGFEADLSLAEREAFFADPAGLAAHVLQDATSRIVYDLDRFRRTGQPAVTATIVRETHASAPLPPEGLRTQVAVSYSDGFGREIQHKVQAWPGPIVEGGPTVASRWTGSGWTIFNNKGLPVRKFEPFFDDNPAFRFNRQAGVSSTRLYDPIDRLVATLNPDHTWSKVVFDQWHHATWDVNDTVLIDDPRTDADVGAYFARLPQAHVLPTWHQQRQGGALGPHAEQAATSAAAHAGTPSVAHADPVGRTFLTVAHNRLTRNGATVDEFYTTRAVLDIQGHARAVTDAKGRLAMRYDIDLAGARLHQASMESGERWAVADVMGRPLYAWDSRDHRVRSTYDAASRPAETLLRQGAGAEVVVARTIYGEAQPGAATRNLRGRVVQQCDQAGVVTTDDYDFKGNLLRSQRQLARNYKTLVDWSAAVDLEPEVFTGTTAYDALNRPRAITSPDGSVYRPRFNEANLFERITVALRGAATETPFVTRTDYNARGQRLQVAYGNGVTTSRHYDAATFRVARITTTRGSHRLQDLHYTYDAGGNITHVQDDAQQALYFANAVVDPHIDYEYDAVYRLVAASGREHAGQLSAPEPTWDDVSRVRLAHPHDGQAMRRYTERYDYDAVGNLERIVHRALHGDWTRRYTYVEASQLEAGQVSNRLSATVVGRATGDAGPETYPYDVHGNMLAMAHLPRLHHDFRDQLAHVDLQGGGEAFYVYDGSGQRARKVVEKNGGALVEERIYVGGFELFRRRAGGATVFARETLHVSDDRSRLAIVETKVLDTEAAVLDDTPRVRVQIANVLGSGVLELDETGQVITYEEYHPYGSTSYQAVAGAVEVSAKRYRYAGMERDDETGLNYHTARYYASWLGRWASADTVGIAAGVNLYAYCRGNPVTFTDPNGHDGVSVGEPGDLPPTATLDQIKAYANAHGHTYSDPNNERRYNPDTKQWIGGTLTPKVYDPAADHGTGFGNASSDKSYADDSGIVKSGPYETGGGKTGGDYDPFAPKTPAKPKGAGSKGTGGSNAPGGGTRKAGPPGDSPTGAANGAPGGSPSGTAGATGQTGDGDGGGGGEEGSVFFKILSVILIVASCLTIAGVLFRLGTAAFSIGLRFALTVQAPAEVTAFGLGVAGYSVSAPGVPRPNPAASRAYQTQMNARDVDESTFTRTVTTATGEETFHHFTVSAVPPRTPQTAAVSIVQGKSLAASRGGENGQWGFGGYAYEGPLPAGTPGVQFRVPSGTGLERIHLPGDKPIIRLVPATGDAVPLVDPTHNLSPDDVAEAQRWLEMLGTFK